MVQACLNGARPPGAHPALPTTPAAIADAARAAVAAGAGSLHVHAKDGVGHDTFAAVAVAEVVVAVRAAAPGVELGLTTLPDQGERVAAIAAWTALPDLASVNWHEAGADGVAAVLLARGIGVEAGVWHETGFAAWAASPHRDRVTRVLVEVGPEGDVDDAIRLVERVRAATPGVPLLVHGEDASAWPVLRWALAAGHDTRIGLEDTLVAPDGTVAPDNAALVAAAFRLRRQVRGGRSDRSDRSSTNR